MAREKKPNAGSSGGANLGFEAKLWATADALRGSMDAAEYKHVVLGLIFLKCISDAFEEQHAKLEAEWAKGADPEDPDEYRGAEHPVFWVPPEARWLHLKAQAKQPTIGQIVDDAMAGMERDNPALKGVLPRDYGRPALDKQPPRILQGFGAVVDPMDTRIVNTAQESRTLAAQRDSLLPKLSSGELRVPYAVLTTGRGPGYRVYFVSAGSNWSFSWRRETSRARRAISRPLATWRGAFKTKETAWRKRKQDGGTLPTI